MSNIKCCVTGCENSAGSSVPLHKFPNPQKNTELFNSWLCSVGGDILRLENDHIFKYRRVCHKHFEDEYLCRNNRISNIAVPTLNLRVVSYHRFPNQRINPEQFKLWVDIVGGILGSAADYETYKKKLVCDIHFTEGDRNRNNRLNCLAVPSLHLCDNITHKLPNPNRFPEQYKAWCKIITGDEDSRVNHNMIVCDRHFTVSAHNRNNRLSALSVPTLFIGASDITLIADNITLHAFPHPEKEKERFMIWVNAVGSDLSTLDHQFIHKNRKICHDHFEERHLTWTRRLSAVAIPVLRIPKSSVVNENADETNESASTSVTSQPEGDSDKNTASKLIHRRISCDTISDSVKSLGTCEDPLAIESEEVADHTVSDSESYLEDIDEEISEWSDGIIDEYAQKWEPILKNGLVKIVQDEINSNYLFCINLPSSKPPTLNKEIANLLTEEIKTRDNELVNKQSQLGHALTALGKAMTGLCTNTMETSDILETLNDVGELIADLHYLETEARRSLIVQELDKSFAEPLKGRVRDEYLFGQDVGEFVKPPEVKTTASSITPRMISTFLNKKKLQSPVAPPPVRQSTKNTLQKIMKRPATLTPVYQITKKLRRSIGTSLTTLRTCERDLSTDTGTAAPDPDSDPTAALTFTQQNNIQVYDENCQQPLSPRRHSMSSLTNDAGLMEGDLEDKDTGDGEICILLLDDASLT